MTWTSRYATVELVQHAQILWTWREEHGKTLGSVAGVQDRVDSEFAIG
jgi:hypothetical protein